MIQDDFRVDFAISYAGEDLGIARKAARLLRELEFSVFLADENRLLLVGVDGEEFFERLFSEAKEVIVFISKHYKANDWSRLEWDVIRERELTGRFIPIRLDDAKILGLPSKIIYLKYSSENLSEIIDVCVLRLLTYEKEARIRRPTRYETILNAIRNESRGALAKAYQLLKDNRERTPLEDAEMPEGSWNPCYQIIEAEWFNYSKVKRRGLKILLPPGLSKDEVVFNLKHCCVKEFNDYKPDAVSVCAYKKDRDQPDVTGVADVGVIEFAPFGDWSKAEEGVAYNIPTEEFDFNLRLFPTYFQG